MEIAAEIAEAIEALEEEAAVTLIRKALADGADPQALLAGGVEAGVRSVGQKFQDGDYFIAELMLGGDLAQQCVAILQPEIAKMSGAVRASKGRIVLGTVRGDVHNIGKDLVGLLLGVSGYEIHDLGVNVPTLDFVKKAEEVQADVLALSSLMTITMPAQGEAIKYLRDLGTRGKYKVIVGGAPTTQQWADEIGADGWARTAADAVPLVDRLMARV